MFIYVSEIPITRWNGNCFQSQIPAMSAISTLSLEQRRQIWLGVPRLGISTLSLDFPLPKASPTPEIIAQEIFLTIRTSLYQQFPLFDITLQFTSISPTTELQTVITELKYTVTNPKMITIQNRKRSPYVLQIK